MLDEKPISGDVVTVDDEAGVSGVAGPTHTVAVIRPPCPDVIENPMLLLTTRLAVALPAGRALGRTHH